MTPRLLTQRCSCGASAAARAVACSAATIWPRRSFSAPRLPWAIAEFGSISMAFSSKAAASGNFCCPISTAARSDRMSARLGRSVAARSSAMTASPSFS